MCHLILLLIDYFGLSRLPRKSINVFYFFLPFSTLLLMTRLHVHVFHPLSLTQLLEKDKKKRLGSKRDADEIREHDFFRSVNWADLEKKNILPPFNPNVKGDLDLKNIDVEFTREPVPQSVGKSGGLSLGGLGSSIPANAFEGFSYAAHNSNSHLMS